MVFLFVSTKTAVQFRLFFGIKLCRDKAVTGVVQAMIMFFFKSSKKANKNMSTRGRFPSISTGLQSSVSADRSISLQDQYKSYDRAALIDLERLILICKDNLSLIVCYIENFALLIYFQLTLSLSSLSGTRETRWRSSESRSFQHKIHRIPKQKVGEFLSLKGPFTNYVTHPQYHIIYCLKFIKFI